MSIEMEPQTTIDQEERRSASVRSRQRGFFLTERDRELVQLVAELGWATRNQICAALFSPGAASNCQRRLTLLKEHRYLDVVAGRTSTEPALYRVTRRSFRGRRLVADQGDGQARTGPGAQLEHVLGINDVRCRFARACRSHRYAMGEWKYQLELDALAADAGFVPDGAFVVSCDVDGRRLVAPFLLEVERSPRRPAWIKEKYRRVAAFVASGAYERAFGRRSVRLLVVTSAASADDERRWAMRLAKLAYDAGLMFGRFAARRDLMEERTDPFVTPVWRWSAAVEPRGLGLLEANVERTW